MDGIKLDPLKVNPEGTDELLEEKTEAPEVPEEVREIPVKPEHSPKNPKVPLVKRAAKPLGVGALCGCLLGGGYLAGMAGASTGDLQITAEGLRSEMQKEFNQLLGSSNTITDALMVKMGEEFSGMLEILHGRFEEAEKQLRKLEKKHKKFKRDHKKDMENVEKAVIDAGNKAVEHVMGQMEEMSDEYHTRLDLVEKWAEKEHEKILERMRVGEMTTDALLVQLEEKLLEISKVAALVKSLEGADEGLTMLVDDVPKLLTMLGDLIKNRGKEDGALRGLRDQINELKSKLGQITETSQYAEQTAEKNTRELKALEQVTREFDDALKVLNRRQDGQEAVQATHQRMIGTLKDSLDDTEKGVDKMTEGVKDLMDLMWRLRNQVKRVEAMGEMVRMVADAALMTANENRESLEKFKYDHKKDMENVEKAVIDAGNKAVEHVMGQMEEMSDEIHERIGWVEKNLEEGLRSLYEEFNVEQIQEAVKAISVEDLESAGLQDLRRRHEDFRLYVEGVMNNFQKTVEAVGEERERLIQTVNDSNDRVAKLKTDAFHRWATFISAISDSSEDADALVQGLTDWINSYNFEASSRE